MGVNGEAKIIRKRFDSREPCFRFPAGKRKSSGTIRGGEFLLEGGRKLDRGSEFSLPLTCVPAPTRKII